MHVECKGHEWQLDNSCSSPCTVLFESPASRLTTTVLSTAYFTRKRSLKQTTYRAANLTLSLIYTLSICSSTAFSITILQVQYTFVQSVLSVAVYQIRSIAYPGVVSGPLSSVSLFFPRPLQAACSPALTTTTATSTFTSPALYRPAPTSAGFPSITSLQPVSMATRAGRARPV